MRPLFLTGTLALLAAGSIGFAASTAAVIAPVEKKESVGAPSKFAKNLARTNMGSMLTEYDEFARHYLPSPMGAEWFDEDSATTAVLPQGHHYYLVVLQEPNLLQNFMISGGAVDGTISIYTSDQKLPPGNKFWKAIAKDVSAETLKEEGLSKPFFRYARYLLVETNLKAPAEISSFYLFGDSDSSTYEIKRREKKVLPEEIVGPYQAKSKTQFNLVSLYAQSLGADKSAGPIQKPEDPNVLALMDESPLSKAAIGQQPMQIDLHQNRGVGRFSMEVKPQRGKLVFTLQKDAAPGAKATAQFWNPLGIRQVSWTSSGWGKTLVAQALGGLSISARGGDGGVSRTVNMDGSSGRVSLDLPETDGRFVSIQFESPNAQPLEVQSFGVFSSNQSMSVSNFEVGRSVNSSLSTSKPVDVSAANSTEADSKQEDKTDSSKNSQAATGGTSSRVSFTADGEKLTGDNLPKVLPVSN